MKIFFAIVEILIGVFFLMSAGTDIQLGFGLVLIALGINLLTK